MAKTSYPDLHNFKFVNPSTGITNVLVATNQAVVPFGNAVGLGNVSKSPSNLTTFAGALQFLPANVPQLVSLAPYWDRYRVNSIKVRCIPEFNIADVVGSGAMPVMRVIHDYDDAIVSQLTAPQIWGRRGKEYRCDKPFSFSFVPRVNYNSNSLGVNAPMLIQKCPWINCATTGLNIPLYGIKFGIRDWLCNATPNTMILRFEITYFMSFKEQQNSTLTQNIWDFDLHLGPVELPDTVDLSGNIYDPSGNLLFTPDLSGNEIPYVPPPPT